MTYPEMYSMSVAFFNFVPNSFVPGRLLQLLSIIEADTTMVSKIFELSLFYSSTKAGVISTLHLSCIFLYILDSKIY